jgi:hypothetical protein
VGVDISIEVEPRQPSRLAVSEDLIEQYYRAHVPAGGPPLSAIRDYVVQALAPAQANAPDPVSPLLYRYSSEFGRDRVWFNDDLESLARELGVTPLEKFVRDPGPPIAAPGDYVFDSPEEEQSYLDEQAAQRAQRTLEQGPAWYLWCCPSEGLRTVRALRGALGSTDERAESLPLLEEILLLAATDGRRWRVLAFW